MHIGGIKIKFTKKDLHQGELNSIEDNQDVDDIVKDQMEFRINKRSTLEKSFKKGDKSLQMAIFDHNFPTFPIIGSVKIITQEILKVSKLPECKLHFVTLHHFDPSMLKVSQESMQSYVDHLQNHLGDEPYSTVDIIIELMEGIILIERSNPPFGWALPGGFLDRGESLEEAAIREAREETHMELEDLRQFHTYSQPGRDPRFQTISTVFIAKGKGTPQFGDDAKGLKVVAYDDLSNLEYAFDHKDIIQDYLDSKNP